MLTDQKCKIANAINFSQFYIKIKGSVYNWLKLMSDIDNIKQNYKINKMKTIFNRTTVKRQKLYLLNWKTQNDHKFRKQHQLNFALGN